MLATASAADAPRSIVASWETAHKASILLGRRERKGLCRPRACPENPLELVLVCLNNSTGFFAQTVARFEGECQGTATPCREPLLFRTHLAEPPSSRPRVASRGEGCPHHTGSQSSPALS